MAKPGGGNKNLILGIVIGAAVILILVLGFFGVRALFNLGSDSAYSGTGTIGDSATFLSLDQTWVTVTVDSRADAVLIVYDSFSGAELCYADVNYGGPETCEFFADGDLEISVLGFTDADYGEPYALIVEVD